MDGAFDAIVDGSPGSFVLERPDSPSRPELEMNMVSSSKRRKASHRLTPPAAALLVLSAALASAYGATDTVNGSRGTAPPASALSSR